MLTEETKSNQDKDSTLIINLNEEYKIKIEAGNEFSNSIFRNVYYAALKNVEEIIEQSDKNKHSKYDDYNNIIAFNGERGKGKSSSMISFRDALSEKELDKHKDFFIGYKTINDKKFATIEIVDPSLFRGGESLFEIILAQMFQKFQEQIKLTESKLSDDNRRVIIKLFQEVFENLQIINSDRAELYKMESIEALSRLATSSNLRKCFKKLVSFYLETFENGSDFLIIAIDDFDLNISDAYAMLEDIRQFLIQSNIILLVACKMEQLNEIVKVKLHETKLTVELEKKAEKYLEKLFPQHRKITLPNILVSEKSTIIYIGENKDLATNDIKNILNERHKELCDTLISENKLFIGTNPKSSINESIFKISKLFINNLELRQNSFFPDNLRGIINILSILKQHNSSLELVKYIVELAKSNLDKEYSDVFTSLENQKTETLNLALVNSISEIRSLSDVLNLNNILFAKNPLNVNIGDVYTVLYSVSNELNYTKQQQLLFLDLLNIYYSLRLLNNDDLSENIYSFYTSTSIKVFKRSLSGKFRDYIYFSKVNLKTLFDEIPLDDNKFWFIHFFVNLGKVNSRFRFENESPYFKDIQGVNQGLFSPLAIFSNILFPEKLAHQINLKSFEDSMLYMEIKNWNSNKKNLNKLFKNSMFFLELMENFQLETSKAHKSEGLKKTDDGEENYFDTLYVYFTQSLEKALHTISDKYPYLEIDSQYWVSNHPIIKHWVKIENDVEMKDLIQDKFQLLFKNQGESKYNNDEINLAVKLLVDYDNYFTKDQSSNSRGAKQAMNSVVKAFKNKDISQQLGRFRTEMDGNLTAGLINIYNLLKEISNG